MSKYLIIGNSAGGIAAAEAIREVDKEGALTIVSEEPYPAYSRPLIAEYLLGEVSLDGMLFRPKDFYQRKGIEIILGRKATRLDLNRGISELEDGRRLPWEKLLLATGGTPFIPRIEGLGKEGVFTFTTLDDAKRVKEALDRAQRVVIIGGGLIGISAAEAIARLGVEVVIVELRDRILSTVLDDGASRLMETALSKAGVRVITGQTVREIIGQPAQEGVVGGVILDDGQEISCYAVLVAIGVVPRTELTLSTGIEVNLGIVVDRHMATTFPGVYACGDVAEAYDFTYEANRLTPIWPNAYLGGRIAGFNMAGVEKEYPGGTAMNSLNHFGLVMVSAGIVNPQNAGNYEVFSSFQCGKNERDAVYKKVVLKDDRIVGMLFVGDIEKSGIIFGLMRDRVNVAAFKPSLLEEDFGFISFPDELRRERLGPIAPTRVRELALR